MDRAHKGGFEGKGSDLVKTIQRGVETVKVKGDFGGYHSYTEEEKRFFGAFVNNALRDDPHCGHLLPVNLEGEYRPRPARSPEAQCYLASKAH